MNSNNLTEYILNQKQDSVEQTHYDEEVDENLRKFLLGNDKYTAMLNEKGDKIFIIPTQNDKPVKIIYENNGCEICNEMQKQLRKSKADEMILKVYKCNNCGREFFNTINHSF